MSNQDAALSVVHQLRQAGYTALFAGGCVRDQLLGRVAKDFDVVTDAVPRQVSACFKRTLEIGAQFGVVVVLIGDQQIEVATFRTEGGYQDGRRPGYVEFASMKEDASRRDFTVNGMFYDPIDDNVLDFVQGQQDLQKRLLRTIGNPDERFAEDYLRMLRAVRFAVKLDFAIDPATWDAIQTHADKITHISFERIAMELEQILTHPHRSTGWQLLVDSGLAAAVFKDYNGRQAAQGAAVLAALPDAVDFPLALAAMWAGFDTKPALSQCKRLKLSNSQQKHLRFLLEKRDVLLDEALPLSTLKLLIHEPYFGDLITFQKAIQTAKGEDAQIVEAVRERALAIDPARVRPEPLLNGHDLMELGAPSGPILGQLAQELYIAQLEEKLHTKQEAEHWAQNWLNNHRD